VFGRGLDMEMEMKYEDMETSFDNTTVRYRQSMIFINNHTSFVASENMMQSRRSS
jgi:hypothetical protein